MFTVAGMDESLRLLTVRIVPVTLHGFQSGPLLSSSKAFLPALVKLIEESPNIFHELHQRAMQLFSNRIV
jgi:hypothetical protein